MKIEYVIQEIKNDKIKVAIFELEEGDKQSSDTYVGTFDFTIEEYLAEKQKEGEREFFKEDIILHLLNEPIYSKQLLEMFTMQEELNVHTNGPDYKQTQICTKTGKLINYRRAAWMETAEFIDSFDWKHWKHKKDDIENAKTELVDIWHFLLSEGLIENNGIPNNDILQRVDDTIKWTIGNKAQTTNPYALYQTIKFGIAMAPTEFYTTSVITETIGNTNFYESHVEEKQKNFIQEPLFDICEIFVMSMIDKKTYANCFDVDNYNSPLLKFFGMCRFIELSFNELYQRYLVKNVLNRFRQDHGYADGSYIKTWNNDEDNICAVQFANRLGDKLTPDTLYTTMSYFYEHAVKGTMETFNETDFNELFE